LWGLRATDVMQGIVYGAHVPQDWRLATRLDYDEAFGTVINRFCCQAVIGHPLTPYGAGLQRRGFLSLSDSMECLATILQNPAESGEYRVINQFCDVLRIAELAALVQEEAIAFDLRVDIEPVANPRREAEDHYYNPESNILRTLGFTSTGSIQQELRRMLAN